MLVTFDLALSANFPLAESLALIARQGYQRLLLSGQITPLEDAASRSQSPGPALLTVIQDRLALSDRNRARFVEACEQAYHFGKGNLALRPVPPGSRAPAPPCFPTASTAPGATSLMPMPPLRCSVSTIPLAPARPATVSVASLTLIMPPPFPTGPNPWRAARSNCGKPPPTPSVRTI